MEAISGVPLPIIDPKAIYAGTPAGERSDGMVVGAERMLRYAITNLGALPPATSLDAAPIRRMRLRQNLHRWAEDRVDFIQLREKELGAGELFALALDGMQALQAGGQSQRPRLLVNGRVDIAAAARAHGVHLTASPGELHPEEVRQVFRAAGLSSCLVSVSCHTVEEVRAARDRGADLVLFGPVFEKRIAGKLVTESLGVPALGTASLAAAPVPVLALGGVTDANTAQCLEAGAAGIAGIRLFA